MSSPLPRDAFKTDEEYKAHMVRLGEFNKKMYGDKTRQPPPPPPMPAPPPPIPVPVRPTLVKGPGNKTKPNVVAPVKKDAGVSTPPTPPSRASGYAKGGKPVKKAAGGAAKVRKGMMTSEGVITNAMNKVRGK